MQHTFTFRATVTGEIQVNAPDYDKALELANRILNSVDWRTVKAPDDSSAKATLKTKFVRKDNRMNLLDVSITTQSKRAAKKAYNAYRRSWTPDDTFEMSFWHNTIDKARALYVIQHTSRPILYTNGLSYRNPTTYRKPITKEKAKDILANSSTLDITATANDIHINTFSGDDLW